MREHVRVEDKLEEIAKHREPAKPDAHGVALTVSSAWVEREFRSSLRGLLQCANSRILSADSRRGILSALEQLQAGCERRGIADVFRSVVTKKRLAELRKELRGAI